MIMPTARDLLERADALMRRNRRRGKQKVGDVPTLTDALGVDQGATLAPTIILPETALSEADLISLDTLGDVPILTDVVDHHPGIIAEQRGVIAEARAVVGRAPDVSDEPRSDASRPAEPAVESDVRERETLTI